MLELQNNRYIPFTISISALVEFINMAYVESDNQRKK